MMGLRLVDGMPEAEVEEVLAMGERGGARRAAIARAEQGGMLERAGGAVRFTRRGMMVANDVLAALV
jgi:coproporphyrinogen III oxidase-like Fe-S oxidoreductase